MTQEFYALGLDRSLLFALAFLNHFLPNRRPGSEDYPVPQYADDPKAVFYTERQILEWLEQNPDQPYSLYWHDAEQGSMAQAMLFPTSDGKVIFGLAEDVNSPDDRLRELAAFVGAEYSMLGSEQPPPETSQEFISLCCR